MTSPKDQELSDITKRSNIIVREIIEGTERESELKDGFNEIINENFPNIEKVMGNQNQEGRGTQKMLNQKQSLTQYIIVKLSLCIKKT